MSSLFKAPKMAKADPSIAIDNAETKREQDEEKAKKDSEIATRQSAIKRKKAGRASMISGSETGVADTTSVIPTNTTLG